MPKSSDVEQRLKKAIQEFNKLVSEEAKRSPEKKNALPKKMSITEMKKIVKTLQNIRTLEARVERAKKIGFDLVQLKSGVVTTKYQANEARLAVKRINESRRRQREKHKPSTYTGTMGGIRANALSPRKSPESVSKEGWEKYIASIESQVFTESESVKAERYFKNYISALKITYGRDANSLIRKLRKVGPQKVYSAYYNDPDLQINFIYGGPSGESPIEQIKEAWDEYVQG